MARLLDGEELGRMLVRLPGWSSDAVSLRRSCVFPDFMTAVRGIDEIALVAEEMDHHPDVDLRWRTLHLTLSTHSAGGITQLDIELAHRIDEIAAQLGAT